MLKIIPDRLPLDEFPDPKPLGVADATGFIRVELELVNGGDLALIRRGVLAKDQARATKVTALVDSGAMMLGINETIQKQLGLLKVDERLAELADGTKTLIDIVGPIEVRIPHRRCSVEAMVLPGDSEPLLGAIPMEDMDLLIDPKRQIIQVDPSQPYISRKPLK